MMRSLITAGCALALGAAASAQTDTSAYEDDVRGVDEFEQTAPSEFGEDDPYQEDTYPDEAYPADDYEDADDFGDEVDTTTLRGLTPESDPNAPDGLGLEGAGLDGEGDVYATEPEEAAGVPDGGE